jgi:peroxiredoxin
MQSSTKNDRSSEELYPRRLHDLQQRFAGLYTQLPDSPQKDALSVLHAMLQEIWRELRRSSSALGERGVTMDDIAELYKNAPKMEGERRKNGLPVGTTAPDFALPDASGRKVGLGELRGHPVVLVFYPLDWSPGCSQQLDLYQESHDEFERRRARLVAISVDSLYSHGAWAAVRGIEFPLLADFHPKGDAAQRYDVYRDEDGFSERAVFVLDESGVIRYTQVSPFLHHVPDIYELFAALDALPSATREPTAVGS